jgi:hypothetical protein
MIGIIRPRLEILPVGQQQIWTRLRSAAQLGFSLYGGTAIALRLGHRTSVDFDFFSERPLDRDAMHGAFPFLAKADVVQDRQDSLTVLVPCDDPQHEQVKVSFFGDIDFGRVGEPDLTEDGVLQIASLDDLMATKLKVILQRVEAKDYRDVAAMLSAGVELSKGLAAARAMYGPNFQPFEGAKALVYFQGGDLHTLTDREKSDIVEAVSAVRDLPHVAVRSRQLTGSPDDSQQT